MSIDSIKSVIGKKGGLAPSNRFQVIFSPPAVSLLNLNPENIRLYITLKKENNDDIDWRKLIIMTPSISS